jgi:predicted metal-dependent phosphoesterase TrpH
MDKYVDLHTHTTFSDGSLSPGELVELARASGLAALAVTDHDTVDGLEEALSAGEKNGVEVIAGIEISVNFRTEMHMLGYFPGKAYQGIQDVLVRLKKSRDERNPKIIRKLNEMGFDITLEDAEAEASGSVLGRPHIASVLVKKGFVKSMNEAFDKYLMYGRPAYFKKDKLTPEQGIKEIIKAGGIPVLAHPVFLNLDTQHLDVLLSNLSAAGLKGIEVYYVENSDKDTENLIWLASRHNLLQKGGSDFHGSFKPDISLGKGYGNLRIPYDIVEKLKQCGG